jgi:helix-turn-helix protein
VFIFYNQLKGIHDFYYHNVSPRAVVSNTKAKLGQKKQGLTLGGPQKKINVHRNVALFRIFYDILYCSKVTLMKTLIRNSQKLKKYFLKKIKNSVTISETDKQIFRN